MQPIPELPERRHFPAWIASVLVHATLFTLLGIFARPQIHGSGEEPDRPIGISLVKTLPEREVDDRPDDKIVRDAPPEELREADPAKGNPVQGSADGVGPLVGSGEPQPLDLAGLFSATAAVPEPSQQGPSADASGFGTSGIPGRNGQGMSPMSAGGSKIQAEMFGVPGYGHRFLFVIDRSDSMNEHRGRPLAAAKRELLRTLKSIGPKEEFQVIFYSDKPYPVNRPGQPVEILTGEPQSIRMVEQVIQLMMGAGGTNHVDALKMALRMRPDVIFFLTDARTPRMTRYQLDDLSSWAQSQDTTIHCIEFGTDLSTPDDSFLIDLAKMCEGQYRYFNVTRL